MKKSVFAFAALAAIITFALAAPSSASDAVLLKMASEGRITFDFVKGLEMKDFGLIKNYSGWNSTRTKYFEIMHGTGETDIELAAAMAKRIDAVFDAFQKNFGFSSETPVKCYIYPCGDDALNAICSANSQSIISENAVALNIKNRKKPLDTDEIMAAAAHEYAHLATLRLAGRARYEPVFSEGIASYFEISLSGFSWEKNDTGSIGLRLKKIGAADWGSYDEWPKFYMCPDFEALSYSVYRFLDERYGREKLTRFLAAYFGKENLSYREAFLKAYSLDCDRLNAEWAEYYGLKK